MFSSSSNVITNISNLLHNDEWNSIYRVMNGDTEATNEVLSITKQIREFFKPAPTKLDDDDDDDNDNDDDELITAQAAAQPVIYNNDLDNSW